MEESNQAYPPGGAPGTPAFTPPPVYTPPLIVPPLESADDNLAVRARRGMVMWLVITLVLGVASVLLGQPELGATLALGLVFAVTQAAGCIPGWRLIGRTMEWLVQGAGVLMLIYFAVLLQMIAGETEFVHPLQIYLFASAALLIATIHPRAGDAMARPFSRGAAPDPVLVLTVRTMLVAVLLCVPLWFAYQRIPDMLGLQDAELFGAGELLTSLAGYALLALAGVGWLVRRDVREAFRRLGVERVAGWQWAWVILGTAGLFALANGGDWFQSRFFPDLFASDRRFDEWLAGSMGTPQILLLSLSAGIGEEITIRGALQPRVGIVAAALLFAAMHVQYSWLGIAFIFVFGAALGWIRSRTNTSASVLVHVLYDMSALLLTSAQNSNTV
jgi:membrane protease YdiL (CAAX protease family)